MKTILAIFVIGGGIALIAAYSAYWAPHSTITEVAVLRDITEPHFAQPKAEEIIPIYSLAENQWNGGHFSFSDITDVDYNTVRQASLEPAQMWLSNQFEREKEVKRFMEEIEKILNEAKSDSVGRNNTSAYLPIATELNRLSKSKAERRILLVYSDLMENGISMSLYGKQKLDSLISYSDSLLKYFESQMVLMRLDGITVYLIYQSQNNGDSERYRAVSEFYRSLLESKGARVIIGANLML